MSRARSRRWASRPAPASSSADDHRRNRTARGHDRRRGPAAKGEGPGTMTDKKLGFVGMGRMGGPLSGRLIEAGYALRSEERRVGKEGALAVESRWAC